MNFNRVALLVILVAIFMLGIGVGNLSIKNTPVFTPETVSPKLLNDMESEKEQYQADIEMSVAKVDSSKSASNKPISKNSLTGAVEFSSNLDEFLTQLSELQGGIYESGNYSNASIMFLDNPNLVDELLELMARQEADLAYPGLITAIRMAEVDRAFYPKVMQRLKNSNNPSVWLSVLRGASRLQKDDVVYLSELLPTLDSDKDIGSALFALGQQRPDTAKLNVRERNNIAQRIKKFQGSDDPSFRTIAIQSLYNYPTNTIEQDLITALDDPDFGVRIAVTRLLSKQSINSGAIKSKLISMVNDPTVNLQERVMLTTNVLGLDINESERQAVIRLRQEMLNQFNSINEQKRSELMNEGSR